MDASALMPTSCSLSATLHIPLAHPSPALFSPSPGGWSLHTGVRQPDHPVDVLDTPAPPRASSPFTGIRNDIEQIGLVTSTIRAAMARLSRHPEDLYPTGRPHSQKISSFFLHLIASRINPSLEINLCTPGRPRILAHGAKRRIATSSSREQQRKFRKTDGLRSLPCRLI